ncbi:SDR family NAD(P)-dependent oxidoreductase [Albirhodobacter sp. R86504]|uniref:SDR family NAD(P)-dependent oxidoreductase n=1 Tax=Albirhodobacter sp. R86504 TaxID=3093848 RepID=UPI00367086CF
MSTDHLPPAAAPQTSPSSSVPPERLALITGASRGLGAAMAEELAARGWHVLCVARTTGALEELDDRIQAKGGSATLAPMDVTDPAAMAHLAASIHARWGGLGLWVHTAVYAAPLSPAGHLAEKDINRSTDTNIKATMHLVGVLEPLLLAAKGTAMFFDDPRGGQKFFGAYGSTKAAQIALARSWQAEAVKVGPRVLIETPAPMATAVRARFFPGEDRAPLTPCRDEAARLAALI